VKKLYLFPDTNIFLHCKPLDQVSWSALGEWDQIEILLTRPVATEIDELKGKGSSRRTSRARDASSLIRKLLDAEGERQTLRRQPLVELCLRQKLRRDESVSGDLNYEERDDQLVGIALGFQKSNPDTEVWLLTNDTGPMASAKVVGLKYREVPEIWLLPSETDEAEKQINALKARIAQLESSEPSFDVKFQYAKEQMSLTVFQPLSRQERDELLARLAARFPKCSDFGPSEVQERIPERNKALGILGIGLKEVFHPVTENEKDKYLRAYAKWEQRCAERLSNLPSLLHESLNWPKIIVRIENIGSRPADDTLVTVDVVHGSLLLCPPKGQEDEAEEKGQESLSLLPAPVAPTGKWETVSPFGIKRSFASEFARPAQLLPSLGNTVTSFEHLSRHDTRDPNEIYFKVGQRGEACKHIEYECKQWRHAQSYEDFEFDLVCPLGPKTYSASVKVEVHAANLTVPVVAWLKIELSVTESSCLEVAEQMIAAL
jgi:hypothetical protein